MYYIIRDLHKFTEQDVWADGCQPDTGRAYDIGVSFEGTTVDEVIRKARDFVGCDDGSIERDACDEPGRVDFAVTESDNGIPLSERERQQWKAGEIRAWYAVYSGFVESVERVSLK